MSAAPDLVERVEDALLRGRGGEHLGDLDEAVARPGQSRHDLAVLLQLRSRVHRQLLAFEPMLADAAAAADLFGGAEDVAAEARAAGLAAIAAAESGDVFAAADLAVRARVASPDEGGGEGDPWVLNRIGIFCQQMYDLSAALTWWRRGIEAARRTGDEPTEILLVHNAVEATYTSVRLGDLPDERAGDELEAAERGARWLAAPGADGAPRMPVDGARLLAQVLAALGRPVEALAALERARGQLDDTADPYVRASLEAADGWCLLVAGRPGPALAALDRSLLPRPSDATDTETLLARTDRADALDRLGRPREALEESRRAGDILVDRLRRQGRGVLREVDLRATHELERSRLQRRADGLARDALRDPLTGAGNRRRLGALASELAPRARAGAVLVDLDRFKQVNDRFGHTAGDAVLVETVRVLLSCCRDGDEVVRLGGEEFALVCPDVDGHGAVEIGERVRAAVEGHDWQATGDGLRVTASVGTASGPGGDLEGTLVRADLALLEAKRAGRNRVHAAG